MRRSDALALLVAAASWGGGTVMAKQAVGSLPPATLFAVQLAASVAVLAAVVRARGVPVGALAGSAIARLGLLNPGLAYALGLVGLASISASAAVLLWAVEPLLILALGIALLGERPGRPVAGLSALAFVGILVAVGDGAQGSAVAGVAITLAGVACCAVYTIATRRRLPGADSTLEVVLLQQAYALALAAALVAAAAVAGVDPIPATTSPAAIGWAVGSGVAYYSVAYLAYLSALRRVEASVAAVSFYLIPVFGLAVAWVAGERLSQQASIGAAVAIGAVLVVAWVRLRGERPEAAAGPA